MYWAIIDAWTCSRTPFRNICAPSGLLILLFQRKTAVWIYSSKSCTAGILLPEIWRIAQTVNHSRFLYTKLLSLRPLLLSATKRERQSPLQSSRSEKLPSSLDAELIRHCCNTCLITAHDLVETIHQHLDTAYKSSGWHSVYCRICHTVLQPSLTLILG
jgi:hypothetical protein